MPSRPGLSPLGLAVSIGEDEEVHRCISISVAKGSSQAPSACRGDTSSQGLREGGALSEIRIKRVPDLNLYIYFVLAPILSCAWN